MSRLKNCLCGLQLNAIHRLTTAFLVYLLFYVCINYHDWTCKCCVRAAPSVELNYSQ